MSQELTQRWQEVKAELPEPRTPRVAVILLAGDALALRVEELERELEEARKLAAEWREWASNGGREWLDFPWEAVPPSSGA